MSIHMDIFSIQPHEFNFLPHTCDLQTIIMVYLQLVGIFTPLLVP